MYKSEFSFIGQNYDQLEECKINTNIMPYSSSLALWTQVKSKEGEHLFLASTNLLQDGIDKDHMHLFLASTNLFASTNL